MSDARCCMHHAENPYQRCPCDASQAMISASLTPRADVGSSRIKTVSQRPYMSRNIGVRRQIES